MAKQPTIVTSRPIVAVDLGSDGVRAMAAERIENDVLRILGYEESHKFNDYMERGVVMQTSNAGYMIGEVLHLLANRIGEKDLPTTFVTTGGKSMQISTVFSRRDLCRPQMITKNLLEELENECKQKTEENNANVGVLGLVPSFYKLDGIEQDTAPTPNQRATLIEAHYIAFVCRKDVNEQLLKAFDQSGKLIETTFVRPEVLLSAFATADGSEILSRGCGVLDMGAQTTTLTIYKGGQYLYNKVIPQGSNHITKLVAQQGISYAMAEKLKTEYGFSSPDEVNKNYRMRLHAPDGEELIVTSNELSELIQTKLEEILGPVIQVVNQYADRIQRLYITGGGSMLQGIDQYLSKRLQVKVMYGSTETLLTRDTDDEFCSPKYASLVGALLLGADWRETHRDNPVRKPTIWDRIAQTTYDLFSEQQ